MFQRKTRSAFPARNLVILAALILGLLYLAQQKLKNIQTPTPKEENTVPNPEDTSNLRPAEWFFTLREWPDFRTDVRSYTDAMKTAAAAHFGANLRDGFKGFTAPWTQEGPGNIGARINTVEIHPNNPNILYIGYSQGGVWKSVDGGQSWNPVFDAQSYLSIADIVIDPGTGMVYVSTGDPNISAYPFIGDGLWRSADEGASWQQIGLENQKIISKIILHPQSTNTLYAGVMGLPFERNTDRGLYKTTNNGASWQQSLFLSEDAGIIDMVMSPANPNTLYAAGWDRIRNNQESLVSGEHARIWKTTDGGANWTQLGGGLPEGNQSRIGLAIDPSNANHLFASYVNTSLEFSGLFETFDGGETWNENPGEGLDYGFQSNFAWYFGQIRINPYNPLDIWLLGVQSYRSEDGGETWYLAAGFNQDIHADHHDIAFLGAGSFLLGTDGGLYRSTDNAVSWQKIENIPTTQFYRVGYNPHLPDFYFGGAQDNGTSMGNAANLENWIRVFGADGFQPVFHPTDPNVFYYEFQNGAIFGTTDGFNFDNGTNGIDGDDRRHWDMQYLMSSHDPDFMYTGTYRVYQSFGHLPTWTPISEDLTDGVVFSSRFHTISTLHESPLDADLIYVGTTDANVWLGRPFSQSWVNITAGLPERYVSSVKASPSNPNRVFVSHTGYKSNDFTPHLHRSDNQGASWTPIQGDLPNLAVNDLFILPDHQDSVIFAATDGGMYGTLNGGQHWERLGTGIPMVPVFSLGFNPAKQTLIAGTHARSIFTFPIDSLKLYGSSSTSNTAGSNAPSVRITPNPASIEAHLRVENLKTNQAATVCVVDLSGKILLEKTFSGYGKHEETIDLHGFAPGIYLVYVRSNGKTWGAQKMVVSR